MENKPPVLMQPAPVARKRLSISVFMGIASLVMGGGGMAIGILTWHGPTFVAGALVGITLGIIAGVWGIIDCIIGMVKTPTPPAAAPGLPSTGYDGLPPTLTPVTTQVPAPTQAPEASPRRSGGMLALLLGGGSIAAIVTTLVVIVGVAVGLLYVAFWILMWILDNWSGGAMVI